MDNDKWNFDYLDKLLADEEIPNDIKRDVAVLKENHTEMKEKLDRNKKKLGETVEKLQNFDEIIGKIDEWTKSTGDCAELLEPLSDNPDILKSKLKELKVLFCISYLSYARVYSVYRNAGMALGNLRMGDFDRLRPLGSHPLPRTMK